MQNVKIISIILVIKHGALGDIIQALDKFASLRLAYPKAHIALLTTPAFASFFTNCPWFDDIHLDIRASFWRLDIVFLACANYFMANGMQ